MVKAFPRFLGLLSRLEAIVRRIASGRQPLAQMAHENFESKAWLKLLVTIWGIRTKGFYRELTAHISAGLQDP